MYDRQGYVMVWWFNRASWCILVGIREVFFKWACSRTYVGTYHGKYQISFVFVVFLRQFHFIWIVFQPILSICLPRAATQSPSIFFFVCDICYLLFSSCSQCNVRSFSFYFNRLDFFLGGGEWYYKSFLEHVNAKLLFAYLPRLLSLSD
jgi:hypothetical protein